MFNVKKKMQSNEQSSCWLQRKQIVMTIICMQHPNPSTQTPSKTCGEIVPSCSIYHLSTQDIEE